jgi:hypothetical protein
MVKVTPAEPQSASDYDDRTTAAVKAVLIEVGQILGAFKGKFAVVGGAVPWLLLSNDDMPHVGTLDVDLGLDAEALGDGEYATLVKTLMSHGYEQRKELRRFQLASCQLAYGFNTLVLVFPGAREDAQIRWRRRGSIAWLWRCQIAKPCCLTRLFLDRSFPFEQRLH